MSRPPGRPRKLRVGDLVEVRPRAEVLATLADDATVDDLPFMPEMLAHCGSRFTVASRADTTCFYGRLLDLESSVHLTGIRCDGSAHGGCQAGCLIFWKEEWLKPVHNDGSDDTSIATAPPVPRGGCTTEGVTRAVHPPVPSEGEKLWSCQATQIRAATKRIQHWDLRHLVRDVRSGNVRLRTMLRHLVPYLFNTYQVVSRSHLPSRLLLWGGRAVPFVHGRLKRTPSVDSGLQPGKWVRVRSRREIRQTLDAEGRNRGLSFDVEMTPYCGEKMRVQRIVSRVIDDWTGRMITPKGKCIVLDGAVCKGFYHGMCPRQMEPYWREAWLTGEDERADPRVGRGGG